MRWYNRFREGMEQQTVAGIGWFEPFAAAVSPVVITQSLPESCFTLQTRILDMGLIYSIA